VPKVTEVQIFAVELPLRVPFRHAAAQRQRSDSVFLRLRLDDGTDGWGESLPRRYVTGETVPGAMALLRDRIGPALVGHNFDSLDDVVAFLTDCDGAAPASWVDPSQPQGAAWCAVDLALLDAFSRIEDRPALAALVPQSSSITEPAPLLRYSGVVSADRGRRALTTLLKLRAFGLRQVKLKVDVHNAVGAARTARRLLGSEVELRVDANMAWPAADAPALVAALMDAGVRWFEQPVAADDLDTMARLVERSGAAIVADESLTTRSSLRTLIDRHACTGVNVRISKCGGLVAAHARCREALDAGLELQVGCHVGESSLLSSAQLTLLAALATEQPRVRYAEGCFGHHLLAHDPASPVLQFGYGGRLPHRPGGAGLGVDVDAGAVGRFAVTTTTLT
jgi:L-alanine-DL-glutamate epimerase-like enolase superfamily enzyme